MQNDIVLYVLRRSTSIRLSLVNIELYGSRQIVHEPFWPFIRKQWLIVNKKQEFL